MRLSVVGLSHHSAPLEVREGAALGAPAVMALLGRLRTLLPEVVVISTCNRTELYVYHEGPTDLVAIFQNAFADTGGLYRPYLYSYEGDAVARHLFRVASGLDSQLFGEAEILGQVSRAYEVAGVAGTAGAVTSHLFQQALATGKRVRSQTDIGRLAASVSSAAVVLAQRVFGQDLSRCTVLIVGAGEVGQGVARCLIGHGVQRMMVANHHEQRARDLAQRYGGVAVTWPVSPATLAQSDIVITCTGAPETVLHLKDVSAALAVRSPGPQHFIDLALPRDVDPRVAQLPGVYLHTLDDLTAVVATNVTQRQQAQPQAEAIIEEQVVLFHRWLQERQVSITIRHLRAKSEATRLSEIRWALPKLSGLSERERALVDQLTSRLVNKLLHAPTSRLRRAAASGRADVYQQLAQELFELNDIGISAGRPEAVTGREKALPTSSLAGDVSDPLLL